MTAGHLQVPATPPHRPAYTLEVTGKDIALASPA